MRKWKALFKSVVLSFTIYMWFLGSSLLLQIDSKQHENELYGDYMEKWEGRRENLTRNMNAYCRRLEKENLEKVKKTGQSLEEIQKEKILDVRKEKTARDNLVYIPELKQMWCLVPKAASTSWSRKIVESLVLKSGSKLQEDLRNVSIPLQVILRKHFGNIGTKKYHELLHSESIQRILLVRNPLARIVSAFEDKLKDRKAKSDSMYFYGQYGVKINRSFRKNRRINKGKEPTFDEFVEYLLDTDPMDYDEHWKPISLLCGTCRVKYDFVIKQEELAASYPFHLTRLGFGVSKFLRENQRKQIFTLNESKYFENLPSEKVMKLVEKYEDDFRLFGYDYKAAITNFGL